MVLVADGDGAQAVFPARISRQGNGRNMPAAKFLQRAQFLHQRVAVFPRHADVGNEYFRPPFVTSGQRLRRRDCGPHLRAAPREHMVIISRASASSSTNSARTPTSEGGFMGSNLPPGALSRDSAGDRRGPVRRQRDREVAPSPSPRSRRAPSRRAVRLYGARWRVPVPIHPAGGSSRRSLAGSVRRRKAETPALSPARCRRRNLDVESARSSITSTRPPFGANLTALESRFHMTCCSRSASPYIVSAAGSSSALRGSPSPPPPGEPSRWRPR